MFYTKAKTTDAVCDFEEVNAKVALKCAEESIVLLKNAGVLPIKKSSHSWQNNIALYGAGSIYTLKSGTGSGEVNTRPIKNILQTIEEAGFNVTTKDWINAYKSNWVGKKELFHFAHQKENIFKNISKIAHNVSVSFKRPAGLPITNEYLSKTAAEDNCIYVISRQCGEDKDRSVTKGDFLLTDTEVENLRICSTHYKNLILVINGGGFVDLSPLKTVPIGAIIFMGYAGSMGAQALTNLITGKVSPSGKLSASWPENYEQVPFGAEYGKEEKAAYYKEDIFVGYKYYDTFGKTPRYPFGYGLTYTDFKCSYKVKLSDDTVTVNALVKNTGKFSAKEVIQIYVSCPQGKLKKEAKRLAAFEKTPEIKAGASENIELTFNFSSLYSYDESQNSYILEKGDYIIYAGTSSADVTEIQRIQLKDELIIKKVRNIHSHKIPGALKSPLQDADRPAAKKKALVFNEKSLYKSDIFTSNIKIQKTVGPKASSFISKFKPKQMIYLCTGSGLDIALPKHHEFIVPGAAGYTSSKFENMGIPAVNFCDGPQGLRLCPVSVRLKNTVRMVEPALQSFYTLPRIIRKIIFRKEKKGKMLYQYTTCFPCGMNLAQSWNKKLAQKFGKALSLEMNEFGVNYWLAPGMNIMRNPLCGRNFEYFSEDPLLSGKMAAEIVKGVQADGKSKATVKHFILNNQENNRMEVSAEISERALRELYFENFRIAVMEGKPKAVMASYNKINGVHAAEDHDLLTKVLREEWYFNGIVITDWVSERNHYNARNCIQAGTNIIMPGITNNRNALRKALRKNKDFQFLLKKNAEIILTSILDE